MISLPKSSRLSIGNTIGSGWLGKDWAGEASTTNSLFDETPSAGRSLAITSADTRNGSTAASVANSSCTFALSITASLPAGGAIATSGMEPIMAIGPGAGAITGTGMAPAVGPVIGIISG